MTPKAPPTPAPDPKPALLDVDAIEIDEGFNARRTRDEEQMNELVASVIESGVIQPIIVVKREPTKQTPAAFTLVAGHRRIEASNRAKRAQVPAIVYEKLDTASRMQLALVENLQREDINPIDEARGYERAITDAKLTQARLATLTGKPASRISDRLRLLKLPEACQQHIASGALPLAAAKPLTMIAKNAPQVADGCARLAASGEVEITELVEQPHVVVSVLNEQEWEDTPFVHPIGWNGPIRFRGHVTNEELAALVERAQQLGVTRFSLTTDDADAARAFGCLLEIEHQFGSHQFICDARFTYDRITLHLDELAAQHNAIPDTDVPPSAREAPVGDASVPAAPPTSDAASPAQRISKRALDEEKARRAQREAERQQRLDAITANRELGHNLATKLGSKKLDRDTARLLAQIVLSQNTSIAGRGIRYTHPEYHQLQQVRQKNGKVRTDFTPLDPHDAREQLTAWVLRPTQSEEIIGRLLQALIAGTFADERAVAMSNRHHWHLPGYTTNIPQLIAKHSKRLLPQHFHTQAERMLPTPTTATSKPKRASTPRKPASAKGKTAAAKREAASDAA